MKGSSSNYNPYLSGCKARDPVPEILASNSLLMNSLLQPSNKSQNMINCAATADDDHMQEANITRMYVYVPVLRTFAPIATAHL